MSTNSKASARNTVHPAPLSHLKTWSFRAIFVSDDVQMIAGRVGRSLANDRNTELIDGLNEAALDYFRAARRERAGTASDFEKWSKRVATAASGFLQSLGISPDQPMPPLPLEAYVALCSREGSTLTERRYPKGFDYMQAMQAAVTGALVTYEVANHASGYYADRKKSPQEAAKKGLSARQTFVLALARLFEACFADRVPQNPHAGESPFLRFVVKVFSMVAARIGSASEAITLPNDGGDYTAAQALKRASESQIADDVKKRVFPLISPPPRETSPNFLPRKIGALANVDIPRENRRSTRAR